MARMNAGIILSGEPVNALGALNAGTTAAANANQVGRDNAMVDLFQQQGPGIMSGDANALNALAAMDPMAALDVRSTQQQMSERQERLQMARAAAQRQAEAAVAQMSQAEREAEAAQVRQGLMFLSPIYSRGDQAAFAAAVQQLDPNGELGITFENFESQAAMADGVLEVLETFDARNAGPEPGYRLLAPDEVASTPGLDPSRAYQVSPQGQISAVGGSGQTINVSTGPNGRQLPDPPSGYVYATDADGVPIMEEVQTQGGVAMRPVIVPIGGSEADLEAQQAQEQEAMANETAATTGGVVLQDIGRAIEVIESNPRLTSGVGGALLEAAPGTPAHDVGQLLTTVRANIGFDRLQRMRAESPTGGALGNVTVQELARLEAVMGSLAQSQSADQLLYNLRRLQEQYVSIMERVSPEFASEMGYVQQGDEPSGDVSRPDYIDEETWSVLTAEERELFRE